MTEGYGDTVAQVLFRIKILTHGKGSDIIKKNKTY